MPSNAKAQRKRKARTPAHLRGATPEQRYRHYLEEISVNLAAAREEVMSTGNRDDLAHLTKIGKHIAALYRRAGGNPDATT